MTAKICGTVAQNSFACKNIFTAFQWAAHVNDNWSRVTNNKGTLTSRQSKFKCNFPKLSSAGKALLKRTVVCLQWVIVVFQCALYLYNQVTVTTTLCIFFFFFMPVKQMDYLTCSLRCFCDRRPDVFLNIYRSSHNVLFEVFLKTRLHCCLFVLQLFKK